MTNLGNKYLIIAFDHHQRIVTTGLLRERTRFTVRDWIRDVFSENYVIGIIETSRERWFLGPSFETFLRNERIY